MALGEADHQCSLSIWKPCAHHHHSVLTVSVISAFLLSSRTWKSQRFPIKHINRLGRNATPSPSNASKDYDGKSFTWRCFHCKCTLEIWKQCPTMPGVFLIQKKVLEKSWVFISHLSKPSPTEIPILQADSEMFCPVLDGWPQKTISDKWW